MLNKYTYIEIWQHLKDNCNFQGILANLILIFYGLREIIKFNLIVIVIVIETHTSSGL